MPTPATDQSLSAADRDLVLRWAAQIKRELPANHPAHPTMDAVILHHSAPPSPVRRLDLGTLAPRPQSEAIALLSIGTGATLLIAAGAVFSASPAGAITCGLLGALCLSIGISRAE